MNLYFISKAKSPEVIATRSTGETKMNRKLALIVAVLLALALSSCRAVQGTVRLVKNSLGQWEATEVLIPQESVTPSDLKDLEDLLNGK